MKEGVQRGMIRSVEDCKAGIDAVKQRYLNISLRGEKGMILIEELQNYGVEWKGSELIELSSLKKVSLV